MRRLGSLLIFLAIIILARAVAAGALIASAAEKCSPRAPNYAEVSAADLERMLVQEKPVNLENAIITGEKLDLTKHSIASPIVIRNSLILPDLIFTDAVFANDLKFENDCFSGNVNFGRTYFNGGLDVTNSVLLKGVSLCDASANHSLTFDRSRITGGATFSRVRVQNGAYFTLVDFEKGANFIGAIFGYEGVSRAPFSRAMLPSSAPSLAAVCGFGKGRSITWSYPRPGSTAPPISKRRVLPGKRISLL